MIAQSNPVNYADPCKRMTDLQIARPGQYPMASGVCRDPLILDVVEGNSLKWSIKKTKDGKEAERFTEHPLAFDLESLLLLWNQVHSFKVKAVQSGVSGAYTPSSFTKKCSPEEIFLKRYMIPLGLPTPDIQHLKSGPNTARMSTAYFPTVIMDYPVFISHRTDEEKSYEPPPSGTGSCPRWGHMMINLGRTKPDINQFPVLFRPQIGAFLTSGVRTYAANQTEAEEPKSRSKVGEIIFKGRGVRLTKGETAFGSNSFAIPIYRFYPEEVGKQVEGWSAEVEVNGFFSEMEIMTPIASAGFVNIAFPAATEYIDYLEYLNEIWAGPHKGRKIHGSFNLKDSRWGGTLEFDKPINKWSGPIRFAKKNQEDWFLSSQHVTLTP